MYKPIKEENGQSILMAHKFFNYLFSLGLLPDISPYAINIGCGDGFSYNDPVYALYKAGFIGLAIEGEHCPQLFQNIGHFGVTLRHGVFVYAHNIVSILNEAGCPSNPLFLKLDVDGVDAHILGSILEGGIRPLVIQAEINSEIPPPYAFSVCQSDKFKFGGQEGFYGFSLSYGLALLDTYGYKLVELDFETPYTHDGLWVHQQLLTRAGILTEDPIKQFMNKAAFLPHIPRDAESYNRMVAWRDRPDREAVREEIWKTMLEACFRKHGHIDVPFELYVYDGKRK